MTWYKVFAYDRELLRVTIIDKWASESAMLDDLRSKGYRVIEWCKI